MLNVNYVTRYSVDRAVNTFVIANGLNKKEFRYLLLSYTGYGFGLNVLNRLGKSGIISKFFPALIKILSLPSEALIFVHFHFSFKTKENQARVFSQLFLPSRPRA